MVLLLMAALGMPSLYTCSSEDAIAQLIVDARDAKSLSDRIRLLDRTDLSEREAAEFMKRAMRDRDDGLRVFAMMLLTRPDRRNRFWTARESQLLKYWKMGATDESEKVRRIAWVSGLTRGGLVSAKEHEELLTAGDPVVRASAVLAATSVTQVAQRAIDSSPFVRAVAARRLGHLCGSGPPCGVTERAAIDVLLVDANILVRSNALVGAVRMNYLPASVMRGLVLDSRSAVLLEELFSFDERDAAALRKAAGLTYDWSVSLLGRQTVKSLDPPEWGVPRFVRPLDGPMPIGSLAAEAWANQDDKEAKDFLQWATQVERESRLYEQLRAILDSLRQANKAVGKEKE